MSSYYTLRGLFSRDDAVDTDANDYDQRLLLFSLFPQASFKRSFAVHFINEWVGRCTALGSCSIHLEVVGSSGTRRQCVHHSLASISIRPADPFLQPIAHHVPTWAIPTQDRLRSLFPGGSVVVYFVFPCSSQLSNISTVIRVDGIHKRSRKSRLSVEVSVNNNSKTIAIDHHGKPTSDATLSLWVLCLRNWNSYLTSAQLAIGFLFSHRCFACAVWCRH